MAQLSPATVNAPAPDVRDTYIRSYLRLRTVIGCLGILLPLSLFAGEAIIQGGVGVRGSLSAYYHTSMRDIFVGTLCVTGFLLITYLAGELRTRDFWISLISGMAAVLVALFPTERPDIAAGEPHCARSAPPAPPGCTALQQFLGERMVATIHFTCAAVFIASLVIMCWFVFAPSMAAVEAAPDPRTRRLRAARRLLHRGYASLITLAGLFAAFGSMLHWKLGPLTPLYLGEVVSVLVFGIAWLTEGADLGKMLRSKTRVGPGHTPEPAPPGEPVAPVEPPAPTPGRS